MTTSDLDVAIVGAGAAGLMAAIFAGRTCRASGSRSRIAALDGARRIGAKILIAGGGRCNVTHERVTPGDFHGNRNAIARVLRSFSVPETIRFFEEIGVRLEREETGKLFPVTDRAQTVLDALLRAADDAAVDIRPDSRVISVRRTPTGFAIETSRGSLSASAVVLATGGRSVPKTGSDGAGYELARSLGHTVTPVFPALVPLVLAKGHWMTDLKGLSVEAELRLRASGGKILERRTGSLLFAHFGITGPVVLDVSRSWIGARRLDPEATLEISFSPDESFGEVEARWVQVARDHPRTTVGSLLKRTLPVRLAEGLAAHAAGVDPSTRLSALTRDDRRRLSHAMTGFPVDVRGDRGFDVAEVTAGGVPMEEIDTTSMASRRCDGLYLCGEILDVDGRIGGFNFQWAWASGRLAGIASAS